MDQIESGRSRAASRPGRIGVVVLVVGLVASVGGCKAGELSTGSAESDGGAVDVRLTDRGDVTPDAAPVEIPPPDFSIDECLRLDGQSSSRRCSDFDLKESKAVFVSPDGSDDNPGTRVKPLRKVSVAVRKASEASDKNAVIVQVGEYEESFRLREGVHLYGGYDTGWERARTGQTVIEGRPPVLKADGITATTRMVDVEVRVAGDSSQWQDVVTAFFAGSDGIELYDVWMFGADGGDGAQGIRGQQGGSGSKGDAGEPGRLEDDRRMCSELREPKDRPANGGDGGASACEDGQGGRGGEAGIGSSAGQSGQSGGASGGSGGQSGEDGADGDDGREGRSGGPGAGGSADGRFAGIAWEGGEGEKGGAGTAGKAGGGGGGGGGGAAKQANQCIPRFPTIEGRCTTRAGGPCIGNCGVTSYCCNVGCKHSGGGGGGGGGGGCGGKPGEGGKSGGATAVLVLNESNIEIVGSYFEAGDGGKGGAGGEGGPGGRGGRGGQGGQKVKNPAAGPGGTGGDGGDGGKGGRGGPGGGGAGGPSFGIYTDQPLAPEPRQTAIQRGWGGRGGSSPASEPSAKGERGLSEKIRVEN